MSGFVKELADIFFISFTLKSIPIAILFPDTVFLLDFAKAKTEKGVIYRAVMLKSST